MRKYIASVAPLGALILMTLALAACQKQVADQNVCVFCGPTAPSPMAAQCSDGTDNDNDGLIDIADGGCHWDGNAGNPASYDPNDNDERNSSGPGTGSAPGGFGFHSSSCESGVAVLAWAASTGAEWYEFEQQLWTSGPRVRVANVRVAANVTNVRLPANTSSDNYWLVVAGNAYGTTRSSLPDGYRADVAGMRFACAAPPSVTAPTPTPTPGTPTPAPTPGTPTPTPTPSGATCTSGVNFSPFGGSGAQFANMQLTPTVSGCSIRFTSNAPNKVSVTSGGHVTFLNAGSACIQLNGGACGVFTTR